MFTLKYKNTQRVKFHQCLLRLMHLNETNLWNFMFNNNFSRSPFIHFPPSISQPQKGQLKNDPRPKLTHVRNIHWWAPRSSPPPSPWRSQKSKINWTHESWVEEWPPQVDAQNFRIIHHFIPSQPNTTILKSSIKYSAVWLTFYCLLLQNTKLHSSSVTLNDWWFNVYNNWCLIVNYQN